nr:reverse transcriptase domain-containing protein [Tanacetum cinerariifolium]
LLELMLLKRSEKNTKCVSAAGEDLTAAKHNAVEVLMLLVSAVRHYEKEARKIRLKARQYEVMEGILYKRSFLTPWLRCVGPLQAEYVMKEIHKGSCSMHAGPRLVVAKAIRLGYFWPTMHRDAQDMIRKCSDCQIHRPVPFRKGRESQVLDHRNGLLHEMDRSKSGSNDYQRTIIPAEIRMPTYRTTAVDVVNNDKELRLNLDLQEERRELAAINEASNDASHAAAGGKLGPKWEGPYEVTDALGNGAYKLRSMDGTMLPRTWNVANLRMLPLKIGTDTGYG